MAQNGPEDLVAGAKGAGHRAGDFRDADAAAVGDGHFGHTQSPSQRLDLHLAGPPEGPVPHGESPAGVPADGPEGPQIRVPVAVEEPDQEAGEEVAEAGLRQERPGFPPPERAGADDEVRATFDRCQKRRHLLGVVRVVSVQKNHDVGGGRFERRQTCRAGAPGTAPRAPRRQPVPNRRPPARRSRTGSPLAIRSVPSVDPLSTTTTSDTRPGGMSPTTRGSERRSLKTGSTTGAFMTLPLRAASASRARPRGRPGSGRRRGPPAP